MLWPVVPGVRPDTETAPLMQKWREGAPMRIPPNNVAQFRALTARKPATPMPQGATDARGNPIAVPTAGQEQPSLVSAVGQRGAEVAGNIWNAPTVGQGIGRVARTIGEGYSAIGGLVKSGLNSLVNSAQAVRNDVVAGATGVTPVVKTAGAQPPQTLAEQEAGLPGPNAMNGPASNFNRQLTDNGVRYSDQSGNYLEGRGTGGGTFNVLPGRASDNPDYANMTNDQRIAANVAAIDADRKALESLHDYRRQYDPSFTGQGEGGAVTTTAPSAAEAMRQYAAGEVGGQGYNMVRNLRVSNQVDQDLAAARASNLASSLPKRYRGRVIEAALGQAGKNAFGLPADQPAPARPGVQPQDLINEQKYGLDVAQFQNKLSQQQRENARAEAAARGEQMDAAYKRRQAFFSGSLAPSWANQLAWNAAGGDPAKAQDILAAVQDDINKAGEKATPDVQRYIQQKMMQLVAGAPR